MIRRFWLACACVLAFASPSVAQSVGVEVQSAGARTWGRRPRHQRRARQFGVGRWLQYTVATSVGFNLCVVGVNANAYVLGVGGSALQSGWPVWRNGAESRSPCHSTRPWITNGDHGFMYFTFPYFCLPPVAPRVRCRSRVSPNQSRPDPEEECEGGAQHDARAWAERSRRPVPDLVEAAALDRPQSQRDLRAR